MYRCLDTAGRWVVNISHFLGALSALIMLGSLLIGVFYRYVLNASLAWSDEVAILAFIWTIFLFSSALVRDFGHVRVALLLDALPRVAANCCNPRLRRTNCFSLVGSFVASLVYQGHA